MSEWFATLAGLHDAAWDGLRRGAAGAEAPMREVGLATIGADGAPRVRTVVLRAVRRDEAVIEVQTDRASAKVAELAAEPRAALLAWDPGLRLQVRLRVEIEVLTGPEVDAAWEAMPVEARRNHGGQPPPGRPMARADAYRETAERDRFAVLRGHVTALESLHLGEFHRRAEFDLADGFAGRWIGP